MSHSAKETLMAMPSLEIDDFIRMQESGSTAESILEEFTNLSCQRDVVDLWSEIKAEIARVGSKDSFLANHLLRAEDINGIDLPDPRPKLDSQTDRTSLGLRDTLFDTLDDLRKGNIEPKDAAAVCKVALTICKTVELEMAAEQVRDKLPGVGAAAPEPLRLGRHA